MIHTKSKRLKSSATYCLQLDLFSNLIYYRNIFNSTSFILFEALLNGFCVIYFIFYLDLITRLRSLLFNTLFSVVHVHLKL